MTSPLQLMTPRAAARLTRTPWRELVPLLEARGARLVKLGPRVRVLEADVRALIEAAHQPTAAEAAVRTDLAMAQALEEMGFAGKRAHRRAKGVA